MCGKWIIGSTVLAHFYSFLFFFAKYSVMPALDKSLFFLSLQTDIDLAISWPALLSTIRKMKLYI